MRIETQRCLIRNFNESDVYALYCILSSPKVMEYIEEPFTLESTKEFLNKNALSYPPRVFALEYKENKKLIYVYGSEGEKAEKIIVGTANKNLFKNENEIPLNENNNNKLTENFILFKVKNYTYLISFYNNYGVKENSYTLTVAKNDEEILFDKELDISTVYDNLFNTNLFKKLPYDNGVVAYYVTYD